MPEWLGCCMVFWFLLVKYRAYVDEAHITEVIMTILIPRVLLIVWL